MWESEGLVYLQQTQWFNRALTKKWFWATIHKERKCQPHCICLANDFNSPSSNNCSWLQSSVTSETLPAAGYKFLQSCEWLICPEFLRCIFVFKWPLSPARFLSFRKIHFVSIYYLLCKSSGARSSDCCPINGIQKGLDSVGWKHTAAEHTCTFSSGFGWAQSHDQKHGPAPCPPNPVMSTFWKMA